MGYPGGIQPTHRVVLIKVPRSAPEGGDPATLFEAASRWWVVAESRRDGGPASPEYALAVVRGRVAAAYVIEGWQPAPSGVRWGFAGRSADDLFALYRGMDVTGYFPPGAANPLRYVNCGTPVSPGGPRARQQAAETGGSDAGLLDKVRRLNAEPLTHLMHGHRELFHSNLIAWFFEAMPAYADAAFEGLTQPSVLTSTKRGVKREKDHLDLCFRWCDRLPVVIENKVFSIPDELQLARYSERAPGNEGGAMLWLLSLIDPSWADDRRTLGGREWRWLSFPDLADRIRRAIPPADHSYEAETMRRYAHAVELLDDIVRNVVVTEGGDPVAMPATVREALGDRLSSPFSKLRGASVAHRLRASLIEAGVRVTDIEAGYTNGRSLLSWYAPIACAEQATAGWQLQGGQFRLALVTPHLAGTSDDKRHARFIFAKDHETLFDFRDVDAILGTTDTATMPSVGPKNQLGFNRYDPDFTYRYKLTPDLTVAQLEAAAVVIARRTEALG